MSRKVVQHKWQYVKNGHKDRLYKIYVHMCQIVIAVKVKLKEMVGDDK